ncbi:hypothetical protein G7K_0214-t1 [Saitoella complicata NRRL Y-17804]|uniref:Uncharacterized protein n=1 Tax=Saitoella complicata (strain BCRC 22490 / CBS 7301 / JCM 7358 / NBRC 10748 / NRRL Y-17804) TaxID=698492 RepID=A0A0E9N817_SAICN|nr:hypothetical protein G7K_0214-t1 [Saitoella complicata NRRL Y-17804]
MALIHPRRHLFCTKVHFSGAANRQHLARQNLTASISSPPPHPYTTPHNKNVPFGCSFGYARHCFCCQEVCRRCCEYSLSSFSVSVCIGLEEKFLMMTEERDMWQFDRVGGKRVVQRGRRGSIGSRRQ